MHHVMLINMKRFFTETASATLLRLTETLLQPVFQLQIVQRKLSWMEKSKMKPMFYLLVDTMHQ